MSDTSSPLAPGKGGERRWLGPALLVSLVINLFLAGLVGAAAVHRARAHGPDFGPPPPFFGMLHRGVETLPPDDRIAMRNMMLQDFPVIRPYFLKIDQGRRDLAIVIGTEPFDAAKVRAAFAKVDAAQVEMAQATRPAMISGFEKMKPAQRHRIANMMRKQAERRLSNGGNDGPDGPPPGGPGGDAMSLPLPLPPPPGGPGEGAMLPPPPPPPADPTPENDPAASRSNSNTPMVDGRAAPWSGGPAFK